MKKFRKNLISLLVALTTVSVSITPVFSADVDLSGGIENIAKEITVEAKDIASILFGTVALICLIFTIVKGLKALMSYNKGREAEVTPVILGAIGTIVCALASGGSFFGWFGF